MGHHTKPIKITNLLLNPENPRFERAANQRDAIQMMIADQDDKLIRLAKDLTDVGLGPEPIYVVPVSKGKKQFTVLEGNRRITTIKVLGNPDLIDTKHSRFAKKLKPYNTLFKKYPITEAQCVVFDSIDDANRWVDLKHTGENEGVGTVPWDATQRARFNKIVKGQNPIALQAIEFLNKSKHTEGKLKADLAKLPYTNVERLLFDPEVRDFLGLEYKDKMLTSKIQEREVVKGLTKVAKDFLYEGKTVNDIRNKKDKKNYLESFEKTEVPNKAKLSTTGPWQLLSPESSKTGAGATSTKAVKTKSLPLPEERRYIIPRQCIMKIKDNRVRAIYDELKNLEVDDFANSGSVILRVFVELSIDSFISSKQSKFQGVGKFTTLKDKAEKAAQYLVSSNNLTDHESKGILAAVNNKHDALSFDTLNAFVHNRHYTPNPKDLKRGWDNIQPFVEKLWEINK